MKLSRYSKYIILLGLVMLFNYQNILATSTDTTSDDNTVVSETVNNDTAKNNDDKKSIEEIEKQKEELKKISDELIENIRVELNEIDEKIEELQNTEEYETYPTIRLNIDTPIFGLKSIINKKLKITKDVSAKDVASGYSARTIVKNKNVKLPDTVVGKIVVSTKDLNLKYSLTITEYNEVILKLMNYLEKTESVYDFLDSHSNKMFKEYIAKEKKDSLKDISSRLDELNNKLISQDEKLTIIRYVENINSDDSNEKKYDELLSKYNELNEKQNNLKETSLNSLIEDEKLTTLKKEVLKLEEEYIDYSGSVNKTYEDLKVDISKLLLKQYENITYHLEKVKEYEENSIEKKVTYEDDSNDEKTSDSNTNTELKTSNESETNLSKTNENVTSTNEGTKTNAKTEEVTKYTVYSSKNITNMANAIKKYETKLDELEIEYNKDENNDETNKEDADKEAKNNNDTDTNSKEEANDATKNEETEKKLKYETLTDTQKDEYIKQAMIIYKEFLNYEYNFYLENVNGLVKDTNIKVTNIAKYTDKNVIAEIKYIYIDLPKELENIIEKYDTLSSIELKSLASEFETKLKEINEKYIDINELYEKINVESIINAD